MTWHGIVEGLVGAASSVLAGGLAETAGGWLTGGGIGQSQLLSSASHNSDHQLVAAASALYQQQSAAIQQVDSFYFVTSTTFGDGTAFAAVCLSVCLSVKRISQKVIGGFSRNLGNGRIMDQRQSCLNFRSYPKHILHILSY